MSAISPFTGSETNIVVGKIKNKHVYKCADTGVLFFDRKDFEENDYTDYYPYLKDFDKKRSEKEIKIRKNKTKKQLRLLEKLAPGKILVDLGAGPGYYSKIAADEAWNVISVEISEIARKFGEENYDLKYSPLEEIDDEYADVVICHHVLEHIPDPSEFITSVKRVLKKDGIIALHVPHQQPLELFLKSLIKKESQYNLYGNEHISGFTKSSLSSFLKTQKFEPVVKTTVSVFSKFYDPFFMKNFFDKNDYIGIIKKFIKQSINTFGQIFSKGTWVIVYARKQ